MADTSPEFAGSDDVLEVLESDELVDQFAAAIEAATLADLTEEAGIDGQMMGRRNTKANKMANGAMNAQPVRFSRLNAFERFGFAAARFGAAPLA